MGDNAMLQVVFWGSAAAVAYAYVGYPLLLRLIVRWTARPLSRPAANADDFPTVTMLIPVHNERPIIEAKLQNVSALIYPEGRLHVLFICDGCSDGTLETLRQHENERLVVLELSPRSGKASALNLGLDHASGAVVVFSDASIMLEPDALLHIVRPFASPEVGCVSGEDYIERGAGERLYGTAELALRRLESSLHSIVGASGSFYAQRRILCEPFPAGLAPDFLSVLRTVERGFRAVSEPLARGSMLELEDPRQEFSRKVRTILRGITTLARFSHLLNPVQYGWFAFELGSHKLARWVAPIFLVTVLISSAMLASTSRFFLLVFGLQVMTYLLAGLGLMTSSPLARWLPARISLYFAAGNVAAASAWLLFLRGSRQELWSPTRR
jgi:cellulose synthase/poly-beta-1,6-N-acetylglucosamine synthase-like glycosyltransferase